MTARMGNCLIKEKGICEQIMICRRLAYRDIDWGGRRKGKVNSECSETCNYIMAFQ